MARRNPNKSAHPREYRIWKNMRTRCSNPNTPSFKFYGGRGIAICETWKSFDMFLADMGPCPTTDHTLDRVNTFGPYSSDNCRWATRLEQGRNTRDNRRFDCDGVMLTAGELRERFHSNIPSSIIRRRLKRGWTITDAVSLALLSPELKRIASPLLR